MKRRLILLPILLLSLLEACNFPQPGLSALGPGQIQTAAAKTAAFLLTETQQAETGTQPGSEDRTPTPTQSLLPSDTATSTLTSTPLATFTLTSTVTPTPIPCNWALYVSDVTYPDDVKVPPSWTIEKTWKLRNIGSCTWTSGYQLVFDHGDRMNAPDSVQLTSGTVPPGSTVDATVTLKTPALDGTYQGYFRLRSPEGQVFGIGADAHTAFWIRVKVEKKVDLTAEYANIHQCGGFFSTTFKIGDTGNVGLDSVQIYLVNRTTSAQVGPTYTSDSPFLPTAASCLPGADGPIGPGSTWFLAANFFTAGMIPPVTFPPRAVIKACTGNGLTGDCVTQQVDFLYPVL